MGNFHAFVLFSMSPCSLPPSSRLRERNISVDNVAATPQAPHNCRMLHTTLQNAEICVNANILLYKFDQCLNCLTLQKSYWPTIWNGENTI